MATKGRDLGSVEEEEESGVGGIRLLNSMRSKAIALSLAYAVGMALLGATSITRASAQMNYTTFGTVNMTGPSRPVVLWNKTYGSTRLTEATSIVQTVDGGYVLAGCTTSPIDSNYHALILRLDREGNEVWNNTYVHGNPYLESWAILQTRNEDYLAAGWVNSMADVFILRIDDDGNLVWNRTYGGFGEDERIYDLVETKDETYVGVGTWSDPRSHKEAGWMLKVDAEGNLIWQRSYDQAFEGSLTLRAVTVTQDGGLLVAGYKEGSIYFLRTDPNGAVVWETEHESIRRSQVNCVIETTDGGYIGAGRILSPLGFLKDDLYIVKVNDSGGVVWESFFDNGGWDEAWSIMRTWEGYLVAGQTRPFTKAALLLAKIDPMGRIVWNATYSQEYSVLAWDITESVDGGFLLAGATKREERGTMNAFVLSGYDGEPHFPEPIPELLVKAGSVATLLLVGVAFIALVITLREAGTARRAMPNAPKPGDG